MKLHLRILKTGAALLLMSLLLSATGRERIQTISPDEVKPGMKGYGLSVFQGTEPVRFEVEVISVLKNVLPKQDMILVRCSGQDLDKTKVIAGMSGSPVYIEGKLAGAMSYAWNFALEPIAGITPIGNMLAELKRPITAGMPVAAASSETGFTPIATPLMVSGVSPELVKMLEDDLKPFNLVPIASGGYSEKGNEKVEIKPGCAVGASLISGDVNLTAIGTLTYMDGNTIAAFGHPFLNGGDVNIPLVSAKVHTIIGSQSISFKLASPVAPVGVVTQDRQPGVTGRLDIKADTVPYHFRITNQDKSITREFNMNIAQHPMLTPALVNLCLAHSINAGGSGSKPVTVKFKNTINIDGYPPVIYQDSYASMAGPMNPEVAEAVAYLTMNPFKKIRLNSVDFEMEVSDTLMAAFIQNIWTESDIVHPGDTVIMHVTLKPYNRSLEDWTMEIPVPRDFSQPRLTIIVQGGENVRPDVAAPASFEDLMEVVKSVYPSAGLVASYHVPGAGVDFEGKRLKNLPPSVGAILNPPNATEGQLVPSIQRVVKNMPYVIIGAERISLKVQKEAKP